MAENHPPLNSTINTTTADSFTGLPYWKLRQKLIEEKVIVDFKFIQDYENITYKQQL